MLKQVIEELEVEREQNKKAYAEKLAQVIAELSEKKEQLDQGRWVEGRDWTEGFHARDIAQMGAMFAREQALKESIRSIKCAKD